MTEPQATRTTVKITAGAAQAGSRDFTPGAQAQPFSVGRRGAWVIEAPDIQDVQLYLAFDGRSLQIAAAPGPVSVQLNGATLSQSWTVVPTNSEIRFGTVALSVQSEEGSASAGAVPYASAGSPPGLSQSRRPAATLFASGPPPGQSQAISPRVPPAAQPIPGGPNEQKFVSAAPVAHPHGAPAAQALNPGAAQPRSADRTLFASGAPPAHIPGAHSEAVQGSGSSPSGAVGSASPPYGSAAVASSGPTGTAQFAAMPAMPKQSGGAKRTMLLQQPPAPAPSPATFSQNSARASYATQVSGAVGSAEFRAQPSVTDPAHGAAPPAASPNYGSPPAQAYAAPSAAGPGPGYGPPPAAPGYGPPPAAPGYGSPPAAPGYGSPPAAAGYGSPPAPGYGTPPAQGYGAPPAYGSAPYAAPSGQGTPAPGAVPATYGAPPGGPAAMGAQQPFYGHEPDAPPQGIRSAGGLRVPPGTSSPPEQAAPMEPQAGAPRVWGMAPGGEAKHPSAGGETEDASVIEAAPHTVSDGGALRDVAQKVISKEQTGYSQQPETIGPVPPAQPKREWSPGSDNHATVGAAPGWAAPPAAPDAWAPNPAPMPMESRGMPHASAPPPSQQTSKPDDGKAREPSPAIVKLWQEASLPKRIAICLLPVAAGLALFFPTSPAPAPPPAPPIAPNTLPAQQAAADNAASDTAVPAEDGSEAQQPSANEGSAEEPASAGTAEAVAVAPPRAARSPAKAAGAAEEPEEEDPAILDARKKAIEAAFEGRLSEAAANYEALSKLAQSKEYALAARFLSENAVRRP